MRKLSALAGFLSVALGTGAIAVGATVDDVQIHSSSVGSGPTILFVHGWTCDSTSWAGQVSPLSGSYRVITLDLPGHGKTPPPKDGVFSMDLFARTVEAVRAESGAAQVVLVGHSMGAMVIRQYAIRHPDRVAGLVAVDGPLDMRNFVRQAAEENESGKEQSLTRENRKQMITGMFIEETPDEVRERVLAMMLQPSEATAMGAVSAMFDRNNDTADKIVSSPALIIDAGTLSQERIAKRNEKTKEVVPAVRSIQVEGTGHFLMMEKPQVCNELIQDFLNKIGF